MINLIIPTYNNYDTIKRTLGSICAQTKRNKCVITIVDDCSDIQREDTFEIIDNYRKIIPIKLIKLKEHTGSPGIVRQIGVDSSVCDYVMFLDADDILMPRALEILSREILLNKPDFLVSNFYQEFGNKLILKDTSNLTWLHGKVYKRKFLIEKNIRFSKYMNEDGSFNTCCNLLTENKFYLEEPTYIWMNNKKSITRSNDNFIDNIFEDYVETYLDSYRTILDNIKMNNEILCEIGFRIGNFYSFYCNSLYKNIPISEKIIPDIKRFLKNYNISNYTKNKYFLTAILRGSELNITGSLIEKKILLIDFLNLLELNINFNEIELEVTK